jgi:uncharacterized protein YjbJ (UPF0337 family)
MGMGDKISGRIKQAAGDLTGDEELRRDGLREERKGEARDELKEAHADVERKARHVADLERDKESSEGAARP